MSGPSTGNQGFQRQEQRNSREPSKLRGRLRLVNLLPRLSFLSNLEKEIYDMDRFIRYWKQERAKLLGIIAYLDAGNKFHKPGKSDAQATEESYRRALRGIEQYDFVIAKYS